MTELENKILENLKATSDDFLSLSYDNVHIKDMTRNELEMLCVLLAHQSMLREETKH